MSRQYASFQDRAAWLHRWSRAALEALRIVVTAEGEIPPSGLIVSNHLSYVDVLVFSSVTPCVFVSKHEVADWPLVGWLTRMAGTIYLNRESRKDARRVNNLLEHRLAAGQVVIIFPEGTSSDGTSVLPFHPSLFQSAIDSAAAVTPAGIAYSASEADPSTDVCYWGAMTFATHLWKMFGIDRIEARVCFGQPGTYAERKSAARHTREIVRQLACC
jgi:1-acyl-sn-glycerol-3-phosphate acyltransferase